MKKVALIIQLSFFLMVVSCGKDASNTETNLTEYPITQKANYGIRMEHWSGKYEDDCNGPGVNCIVITPDDPATSAVRDAISNGSIKDFMIQNATALQLDQVHVQSLISGTLNVYPKFRSNDDLQLRLK